MKSRRLSIWLFICAGISLFSGASVCLGANILVTSGDNASNPNPNVEVVNPPPVVDNNASIVAYATVQPTKLPDESRITYDNYIEKKFGKQIDVQEVASLLTSTTAIAKQEEVGLIGETEAPLSKKSRVISLTEMQEQLQENKLILSKPIPLFVGES
ncbi:hypothetical protein D4R78_03430 [bacterium]|nr:MAG: hypothetical protein D4R78_03430 [bacterium]